MYIRCVYLLWYKRKLFMYCIIVIFWFFLWSVMFIVCKVWRNGLFLIIGGMLDIVVVIIDKSVGYIICSCW